MLRLTLFGVLFWLCVPVSFSTEAIMSITTHAGKVEEFRQGDRIEFLISLSSDGYLYLVYEDAKGHLIQIMPQHGDSIEKTKAQWFLQIPNESQSFDLIVQPPYGKETLHGYLLPEKMSSYQTLPLENGLSLLPEGKTLLKQLKEKAIASAHYFLVTSP